LFQFDFLDRASTIYFISVPTNTTLIMQTLDADKDILRHSQSDSVRPAAQLTFIGR